MFATMLVYCVLGQTPALHEKKIEVRHRKDGGTTISLELDFHPYGPDCLVTLFIAAYDPGKDQKVDEEVTFIILSRAPYWKFQQHHDVALTCDDDQIEFTFIYKFKQLPESALFPCEESFGAALGMDKLQALLRKDKDIRLKVNNELMFQLGERQRSRIADFVRVVRSEAKGNPPTVTQPAPQAVFPALPAGTSVDYDYPTDMTSVNFPLGTFTNNVDSHEISVTSKHKGKDPQTVDKVDLLVNRNGKRWQYGPAMGHPRNFSYRDVVLVCGDKRLKPDAGYISEVNSQSRISPCSESIIISLPIKKLQEMLARDKDLEIKIGRATPLRIIAHHRRQIAAFAANVQSVPH
jgi:hypothetical protein